MAEPTEGRDPEGGSRSAEPGGRSSRGPNPDPGGEEQPGGLVPPYEGRTGTGSPADDARADSIDRQLSDTDPGRSGSTSSPADERAVGDDEVTGGAAGASEGVGESTTERGEDVADDDGKEAGREGSGTSGASQRPVGTSDERDSTSVDPKGSQTGSPTMPPGDQGG